MARTDDSPPHELLIKGRRRAPKFGAFIGTGIMLGLVAALLVTTFTQRDPSYSFNTAFGYIGLVFALIGALAAGLLAIWLDHRS